MRTAYAKALTCAPPTIALHTMSYLKFLNLMEAVKGLPTFPSMDAVEDRMLNTLALLWESKTPVTVLQSMEMLDNVSPATAHRRLKTLSAKGFIAFDADANDKRIRYVVPTPLANQYFAQLEDCLTKAQQ
jgi:hypothetical protein